MASQKRTHEDVDPDYDSISDQQAKRQRELELGAKLTVTKYIQGIVRNEFQKEISSKETELHQIDMRLNEARLLMDRLRACVVANYYGRASFSAYAQASNIHASPSIHPTVKKFLGKRPTHNDTNQGVFGSKTQPDEIIELSLVEDSFRQSPVRKSDLSTIQQYTSLQHSHLRRLVSTETSSSTTPNSFSSVVAQTASVTELAYEDRRRKMKKKIIIGNVSKYILVDHREANDMSSHKWMVYVRGPKTDPDISGFVKKVWFFLHHSYKPNDLVEISSPPFHLTRRGWGEFPVRVQLHFIDPRNKKVDVIHHLKLDKTFTGLQTLGAETVVEVELERDFCESRGSNNLTSSPSLNLVPALTSSLKASSPKTIMNKSTVLKSDNTSCMHKDKTVESKEEIISDNGDNKADFEDFNVTISHEMGKNNGSGQEEDMVVDVCDGGSYKPILKHNISEVPEMVNLEVSTLVPSKLLTEDFSPSAAKAAVVEYIQSPADMEYELSTDKTECMPALQLFTDASRSQSVKCKHHTQTVNTLSDSTLPSQSYHKVTAIKVAPGMQKSNIVTVCGLLHRSSKLENGTSLQSNQKITAITAAPDVQKTNVIPAACLLQRNSNLSNATPVQNEQTIIAVNSAPHIQRFNANAVQPRSSSILSSRLPYTDTTYIHLSSPRKLSFHSPQVPCQETLSTSSHSQDVLVPSVINSSTCSLQRNTHQKSFSALLNSSNLQKVVILNSSTSNVIAQKTKFTNSVTGTTKLSLDGKVVLTAKSSAPRQVSLLTGRVITPLTSSSTDTPVSTGNYKAKSASLCSGILPEQNTFKTTNQLPMLNKQSLPSQLSTSVLSSQTGSDHRGSQTETTYDKVMEAPTIYDVNRPQIWAKQLRKQQQISLLSNIDTRNTSNPSANVQSSIVTPLVIHYQGQIRAQQLSCQDSISHLKMSAIGKTKHGSNKLQTLHSNKQASTAEERERSQYEILKAWKENPELYQKTSKGKKSVLATKDIIEGEVDFIPELRLDDYPNMRSLVKAAVQLHPVVQAGVNKLTHPYCAESVKQWNSWPVGKQRASEWHRACFVLKYLKSCLGNQNEFKGEKLMTTHQLAHWCRLHAHSPCIPITRSKLKFPLPDDLRSPYSTHSTFGHFPSYTKTEEMELELSAIMNSSVNDSEERRGNELNIEEVGLDKTGNRQMKLATNYISQVWLPPSDGACFVYDELRKRGMKLKPVELKPGVMTCTVSDMLYHAMQEFCEDILRESVATCAQSSSSLSISTVLTRQDVHKALINLPEAAFCCNKFLGKEELEKDVNRR